MHYILEATGSKSTAFCKVNGKTKIKTCHSVVRRHLLCVSLQHACTHINPHCFSTQANKNTHTENIIAILFQTAAWAGMSLVRGKSLCGIFIGDYIRDSYGVNRNPPTSQYPLILAEMSFSEKNSLSDSKWDHLTAYLSCKTICRFIII